MNRQEYERLRKAYQEKKRRNRQRRKVLIGVTAVLLLGCFVWIIGSWWKGRSKPSEGEISGTPGAPTQIVRLTDTPVPTLTPTNTPSPTPTPTPLPKVVSLVAVGDNLFDWDILEDGYLGDGKFSFAGYYENIEPYVRMADYAVINQETPLGGDGGYSASGTEIDYIKQKNRWGSYHGYATFNTPYEAAEEFMKAGFNVVTSATNHSSDYGYKAIQATMDFWKKYPEMTVLGMHDSAESQEKITVVEKYGIRIAFLNYTYDVNLSTALKEAPYSIDVLEANRVKSDVQRAKEMADFVVVFPHWGTEYSLSVSSYQKEWTKKFAEYGVDVVIGAHPHICEPMEIVTRPDGGKMPVYYSLGNFLSIFKNADCELEGMAYVEFYKDGDTKYIKESTIIPLVNHYNYDGTRFRSRCHFTVYALQDYSDALASEHGCLKFGDGKGFSRSRMEKLAVQLWGDNIKVVDWSKVDEMQSR